MVSGTICWIVSLDVNFILAYTAQVNDLFIQVVSSSTIATCQHLCTKKELQERTSDWSKYYWSTAQKVHIGRLACSLQYEASISTLSILFQPSFKSWTERNLNCRCLPPVQSHTTPALAFAVLTSEKVKGNQSLSSFLIHCHAVMAVCHMQRVLRNQ